jgi:hypothetical protein
MFGSTANKQGGESHTIWGVSFKPFSQLREQRSIKAEDIEPSIYHKSLFFNRFQSLFNAMVVVLFDICNKNYIPVQCSSLAGEAIVIFMELLFVGFLVVLAFIFYCFLRFVYHLLMSSINNLVYHTYSKHVNLTKFGVPKANYREDIQKKIFLNDSWQYDYILNHVNYITKRYHYVMIMAGMFIFSVIRSSQTFVRIDNYFGFNINDRVYTFLQIVVAVIIAYYSYLSSFGINKDLTSFIRSLTDRHEQICDTNCTILRTFDDVMADLDIYRFSHLRTSDEDDIIVSPDSYDKFQVERLRELIVDGEIHNGKKFRFIEYSSDQHSGKKEEIFMRVFSYSSKFHYCPSGIFNIPVNDMRVYDTVSFVLLFVYFFTSLDLQGYFFILFGIMLVIFMILLCIRCYHDKIYCFAFYRRNELIDLRIIPSLILQKREIDKPVTATEDVEGQLSVNASVDETSGKGVSLTTYNLQEFQNSSANNPIHKTQSMRTRMISKESEMEDYHTAYTQSPARLLNRINRQCTDEELNNFAEGDNVTEPDSVGFHGSQISFNRSIVPVVLPEELFDNMGLISIFKIALLKEVPGCELPNDKFVFDEVEKVLIYLIIKNSFDLNYKVHEVGFKIFDFIKFVRDICYHFQVSALITYQNKTGHYNKIYENKRGKVVLCCKVANNGSLYSVERHISNIDVLCESRIFNRELDIDAKEVYVNNFSKPLTKPTVIMSGNPDVLNDAHIQYINQQNYINPANSTVRTHKVKASNDHDGLIHDHQEEIESNA